MVIRGWLGNRKPISHCPTASSTNNAKKACDNEILNYDQVLQVDPEEFSDFLDSALDSYHTLPFISFICRRKASLAQHGWTIPCMLCLWPAIKASTIFTLLMSCISPSRSTTMINYSWAAFTYLNRTHICTKQSCRSSSSHFSTSVQT